MRQQYTHDSLDIHVRSQVQYNIIKQLVLYRIDSEFMLKSESGICPVMLLKLKSLRQGKTKKLKSHGCLNNR